MSPAVPFVFKCRGLLVAQAFQPVPVQVLATLKFTLAHDGLQCKYLPTPQELTNTRTLATRLARENFKL